MIRKQAWGSRAVLVVFLALVTSLGGDEPSWSFGLESATVKTRVVLSGERIQQSSPAAADLDGDGNKEIVVGGQDGMLYVLAYEKAMWSVVWQRQTANDLNAAGAPHVSPCVWDKSDIQSSPAIGDLEGDGRLEIVVSTGGNTGYHRNGGVLVYRYNARWSFSVVPEWPQPRIDQVGAGGGASYPDGCWDGIWSTPALGDLDGDGDLEVVIEGFDRRIHAWHHDGTVVDGWPIYRYDDQGNEAGDCILRGGWSSPALGDIDGDGLPEVIVGTDSPPWDCPENWHTIDYTKSTVWAINGDSSNVPGWPVTTEQTIQSSPALGDIDGDGNLDIVVGTGEGIEGTKGYKVYAWKGDGTPVDGWPRPTEGNMPASPALGDLDSDGDLEVVVGCGGGRGPACGWLYAWHGNGDAVSGFPVLPPANSWPGDPSRILLFPPVLADYDGDGAVEILLAHLGSFGIATVGPEGQSENDPVLKTEQVLNSSPLVGDVDGDGTLEIVVGGTSDASESHGALYIWDVDGDASSELPWPMFHRNVYRTGVSDTISGRVSDVHGQPFGGVTVSSSSGKSAMTDASGVYRFYESDGTFYLTPYLTGYAFWPATRSVILPPSARNQDFAILAAPVSATLSSAGGSLAYTDTQGLLTRIECPDGALAATTTLVLTPTVAADRPGYVFAGHAFELEAYRGGARQEEFVFQKPVTVSISYSDLDVRLVTDETELVLARWTGNAWGDAACSPDSYLHNTADNQVAVALCHLSKFALFGPTHQAYLPVVFR